MPVDTPRDVALKAATGLMKTRIEQVLAERGLSHTDLWKRLAMTEGGYWKMLKTGSLDLRKLARIATAIGVEPERLLSDVPIPTPVLLVANEPAATYGKRYLEQRVDDVETEVRKLKERLRER